MCRGITSYLWLISAISRRLHSEQFNNQIYQKLQQMIFLSIYLHLVKNKITKSKLYALKYIIFLYLTSDLFFLGNFNSLKLATCPQPSIPLMSLVAFIVFLAGLLSGTRGKFGLVLHGETLTKINKLFLFYWNKDGARVITAISSILRLAWRKEKLSIHNSSIMVLKGYESFTFFSILVCHIKPINQRTLRGLLLDKLAL